MKGHVRNKKKCFVVVDSRHPKKHFTLSHITRGPQCCGYVFANPPMEASLRALLINNSRRCWTEIAYCCSDASYILAFGSLASPKTHVYRYIVPRVVQANTTLPLSLNWRDWKHKSKRQKKKKNLRQHCHCIVYTKSMPLIYACALMCHIVAKSDTSFFN